MVRNGRKLARGRAWSVLGLAVLAGCGGGTSGGQDPAGTAPDSGQENASPDGEVSFSAGIQPILDANCTGCHAPGGFAQLRGIPWDFRAPDSRAALVGRASAQNADWTLVVSGDPDASLLFRKISEDSPPVGSRMPLGGDPLAAGDVERIRLWIEQGAPDN